MKSLRLTSFGIMGYVGESLTPDVVMDFASAFGTFVDGGRVLLGCDTRYSSPMLRSAAVSSLIGAGCEVLDLGICPTPMLQFAVRTYEAVGAVSISGGHNAMGWNALTLIGADGAIMEPMGGEEVLDRFHAGDFLRQDWEHIGSVREVEDFIEPYFYSLEQQLDVAAIRKAGPTVLIDPVGGAGCPYLETFAQRLGFTLVPINAEPSGYLARDPEPRPRSASQMASIIGHLEGDVGFVLNSDMARLSIVTESGEPVSEEYTIALIADHALRKRSGTVVTNCCTTRTLDDIARAHGVPVVKTRVGQAYIVSALADEQGVIGGEGGGSACVPEFSLAFDGFLMMGLILEAMAVAGRPVSDLLGALPRYEIVKRSVVIDSRDGYRALEILRERMVNGAEGNVDMTDGLRIDWEDGWVHTRPSRTQQVMRIISEATTKEIAERRADAVVRVIEGGG